MMIETQTSMLRYLRIYMIYTVSLCGAVITDYVE